MTTILEIENSHIEHRLSGLSETMIFKPSIYSTYGSARNAIKTLINSTGFTGLTNIEKEIVARWSLISDSQVLDTILDSAEQSRVSFFHQSHIQTIYHTTTYEIVSPYYSKASKEIIYDGAKNSQILEINVISRVNTDGDIYSVRVFDIINNEIIAEKTSLSNETIDIINLGEIVYQPTNKTILELQIKRNSGNDVIICESFEIKFI